MFLHSWDRFAKVYNLDIESGHCRIMRGIVDKSSTSTGFVKSFLFGKKIAFYKLNGEWWMQFNKMKFNINDKRLDFRIKYIGLITILVIYFDNKKATFIDTNLVLLISRKLDPTHDSWDEENMKFIVRLSELRKAGEVEEP